MENEKSYYNEKIASILNSSITKEQYGEFTPMLHDIFQRRAYEFEFSEAEIEEQIQNFCKNVASIEFMTTEDGMGERAMGTYFSDQSKIGLSYSFFKDYAKRANKNSFGENLYETLAHEVYHAINDENERNFLGLSYRDKRGKWTGMALNEIFTETAADRASCSRNYKDFERCRRQTNGYSDITFVSNMFAASIGVTEKELLKAGLQNRGKLMEIFCSKFPSDYQAQFAQNNIFNKIEVNLDTIYNSIYDSNKGEQTPEQKDLEHKTVLAAMKELYSDFYELASYQISVDKTEITPEYSSELIYRFSKLEKIMNDSLEEFKLYGRINDEEVEQIKTSILQERQPLAKRVAGVKLISEQGHKIPDKEEYKVQANYAKKGVLFLEQNREKLSSYGIDLTEVVEPEAVSKIKPAPAFMQKVAREDFDNGKQWNNREMINSISKIAKRHIRTKDIEVFRKKINEVKENINFLIQKFKNRNQKQLPLPPDRQLEIEEVDMDELIEDLSDVGEEEKGTKKVGLEDFKKEFEGAVQENLESDFDKRYKVSGINILDAVNQTKTKEEKSNGQNLEGNYK